MGERIAYVGTRTTRARNARGTGINVFRVAKGAGRWEHLQCLPEENPSFLCLNRAQTRLYVVHGDQDRVSAYAIDPVTGLLAPLAQAQTLGRNPVHLTFDPAETVLIVANHVTSSLAVLPLRADGSLGPVSQLVRIAGTVGPHRVEQPFAKPHQVEFDPSGRWMLVPDKGLDCILSYQLVDGQLVETGRCPAREGAGPRHLVFHPGGRLVFVVNELDSTVTGCAFDPATGVLTPRQVLTTLPAQFTANSRAAEIALSADGRRLFASNRGSDTIAVFDIDPEGAMTARGHLASGGRTPRFFTLAGETLLVANEDSDTITALQAGAEGCEPQVVARTGSPVCILLREF